MVRVIVVEQFGEEALRKLYLSKDIYIKMTVHISKLGENVDPGNDKIAEEELEPNAAGKLKDNDNESEGVKNEVDNTANDANALHNEIIEDVRKSEAAHR